MSYENLKKAIIIVSQKVRYFFSVFKTKFREISQHCQSNHQLRFHNDSFFSSSKIDARTNSLCVDINVFKHVDH